MSSAYGGNAPSSQAQVTPQPKPYATRSAHPEQGIKGAPQVERELNRLDEALGQLQHDVETLDTRIGVALRPNVAVPPQHPGAPNPENIVGLASRIMSARESVERAASYVRSMQERCEL
jgi:hypothetical protein